MLVSGFSDLRLLHEGGQAQVFRARRQADDLPVVLKALRGPYPPHYAVERFRREAEITRQVQGPGVIGLLETRVEGAVPLLVLEDFGGTALSTHLADHDSPSTAQVLSLAIDVVAALGRVHDRMVVHKDINPSNLVWNADTGTLKLIDFGIASTVSRQRPELASPTVLRGTLPYIAPEQTGRMNRSVDYRSDYYALGVTLFELLVGRTPFVGDDPLEPLDPLELVHAHVALRPPDPREFAPDLPEDIAAVVLRLLSKTADQRYQSAYGLRRDLERCLESARGERAGHAFLLGRYDRPAHVAVPERLYGRQAETRTLLDALDDVAAGARRVVLVEGSAGIGKTSLVNELHRPMVATGGLFVSGKFDQFRRGLPYASLSDAFGQLVLRLLTGAETELEQWRTRLRDALGEAAQVVVDLVPELELLLGPQAPAPRVPPTEAEQRLHLMFRRLVRALATPEQPLVLFVDDLQWADLPTIRLFTVLASGEGFSHLLIIGAWRQREVSASHPWTHALDTLRAEDDVTQLCLGPLSQADIGALLADSLRQDAPELADLARACLSKTGGNPFFLTQFVRTLEHSGALLFDHGSGRWSWDLAAITALGITDNVVELMEHTIQRLPDDSQRALCIASILGATTELSLLAEVSRVDPHSLRAALGPAQEEGLLIQIGDAVAGATPGEGLERYAFVHDRVQQAAYGLLPAEDRVALHLRVGRLLRDQQEELVEQDCLFDVVQHLDAAAALIEGEERRQLVALNLAAGRRALAAAATEVAVDLLGTALDLLGPAPFGDAPELAYAIHSTSATAAYLAQDYDGSEAHVRVLLDHARTLLHTVEALEIRMASQVARNQSAEAIQTGLRALSHLGLELPEHPELPQIMAAMGACGELLAATNVAAIPGLPVIDDAEPMATMRLLVALSPPAYLVRPPLMALLATSIVQRTVRQGLTPASAYGFSLYGLMLCDAGYLDVGHAMGQLALALTERFPDARRIKVRTSHVDMGFCRHWKEPIHGYLDDYDQVFVEGIDIGDFEYAGFAAMLTGMLGFHAGVPLDRFEPQLARYTRSMRELAQDTAISLHGITHQCALNLLDRADDATVLTGSAYDEGVMLAVFRELQHPTGLFVFHCFKCITMFALGEYELAYQLALVAREHVVAGGTATHHLPVFHTLNAILALWQFEQTGDEAERQVAQDSADKVRTWAAANPANLAQKLALVEAELARAEGRAIDALDHYEEAVQAARDNRFLSDEALANRLAARFFEARGNHTAAWAHLVEARYALQRWGAVAAVRRLDLAHPRLASTGTQSRSTTTSGTITVTDGADLDAQAVIQASRAISQEIVLGNLVRLLLKIALESSGGRRAALLLARDGGFVVAAAGRAEPDVVTELLDPWLPADHSDRVPSTVINYVQNTQREILVRDARTEGLFTGDPHIQHHGVRSLLALPVVHQGQMNAILYLDNDQTEGVFAGERLALARVVLAQAAISIENATHYQELEGRVAERTRQLEAARAEAERAHRQADALLKNALPEKIAEELKATGRARPVFVDSATVLFTDFRGFTALAETLSPEELVDELEECFTYFDGVMDRWGLEKLKTIGDAYMAVGGVPETSASHVIDCVMAGLEIAAYMARSRGRRGPPPFSVRIGLHTGPLVAGVIGRRRFAYDVWGDTVNIAARMENTSEPGRVNVSAQVWRLAQDFFVGEARGLVEAKGKGELEMVFVTGLRPELSERGHGVTPGPAFWEARQALAQPTSAA